MAQLRKINKRNPSERSALEQTVDASGVRIPKSFVIRGSKMTRAAAQLVHDLRRVMEPYTASRLKERHANSLKDYMSVAGPLGVTHFLLLTQTEETLNLRVARFPHGPTLYFRVLGYTLHRDIQSSTAKPVTFQDNLFETSPLVVLNNFNASGAAPNLKVMCTLLQGLFPTVNTATVRLSEVKRVVLFHYNHDDDTVEMRHFAVTVKMVGLSKTVKRILKGGQVPDLSSYADISEYVMREAAMSDSEVEEDSLVTIPERKREQTNSQRAIHLVEIGPRLKLQLIKVLDGFCAGRPLYHVASRTVSAAQDDQSGK